MERSVKKRGKKAQVAVFIIIAILVVVVLVILFFPRIKTLVSGPVPTEYVEKCARDAAEEALEQMKVQGGTLDPENYVLYDGEKVAYACYTNQFYETCVMQKPFLKQEIEEELSAHVQPIVEGCFNSLKQSLESKGSTVSLGEVSVDTSIRPSSVLVSVKAPLSVTKESTSSFEKFNVNIQSNLYGLVMLASSISNWEARYGDSDPLTYMLYYPNMKVEKKKQSDGSTVYILSERISGERFMFSSRSMALPPGYIGVVTK